MDRSQRSASLADQPPHAQQVRQQSVSRQTRHEHAGLLAAMHELEAALVSPAPGREHRWAARARQEILRLQQLLEEHILSAEGPGGLFEELAVTRPTNCQRVAELRCEHSQLLQMAKDLAESLYAASEPPDFSVRREQAARFLAMLRRHHAAEVDLVFECFWVDLGVGD